MKEHRRALRRHHRQRVISKRIRVRRSIWSMEAGTEPRAPGHFAKHNMACSCYLCKGNKKLERKRRRQARRLL